MPYIPVLFILSRFLTGLFHQGLLLHFNPEKIKHVEGQFEVRIQYTVVNPNYSDKGEKKFETGKLTSRLTDSLLLQGKTTLKITRQGEGKETSYIVEAAD